ncbi:hypothetical protein Q2K19_18180 [Micromonospora soli]|uniref:hypothetical protein n=1 Tax=Micromonospora sp. NBRC 110009 TaxID=3061627 RepID=UPI00267132CD|nr:hypothetical protein [Micromonospora sp. NBRC 110009]WKT96159.1 hypothetical protein Q2K19_18180 [Micromonospora sp. NBRC 110009]
MPAKRNPKKSRKVSSTPALVDVTPPDLDMVPPVTVPASTRPAATPAAPPKAGPPPTGQDARFAGRGQRAGQTRRYAFRRS